MKLFDTHTHLYLPEFDADRDDVIARAFEKGVEKMMLPNVGLDTIVPMKELHDKYSGNMFMAMGLHPTEIGPAWRQGLDRIGKELNSCDYKAIGEIGMDLYWDRTFRREQMDAFDIQLGWAVERDLPVIIHCREALAETLEVLRNHSGRVKGIFHSFGGNTDDVDRIRECGDFYFGINGIVTFKNTKLGDVVPYIGLERIVLETDAPYLAPVPYRGKRNETSYVSETAKKIADILAMDVESVGERTFLNAEKIFAI